MTGHNQRVLVAVSADGAGGGWLAPVTTRGAMAGPVRRVDDLAAAVAQHEATDAPRWLWSSTAAIYPWLLRAGVRVARCHDVELTEALLLGWAGQWGAPRSVPALLARRHGTPVPPDPPSPSRPVGASGQDTLFDEVPVSPPVTDLITAYQDQQARIGVMAAARRFHLLVAAESVGALIAAEMSHHGLPWRADVHDAILTELLGPRSPVGGPPRRLAELAERPAPSSIITNGTRSWRARSARRARLEPFGTPIEPPATVPSSAPTSTGRPSITPEPATKASAGTLSSPASVPSSTKVPGSSSLAIRSRASSRPLAR